MNNEQRKTTDYQIKKASEYNKAHYIQIALRLSPEDAETVAKIATETRQSKNAVITTAIRLYAQSLTAADTAPERTSPETVTGAKETQAETETETPEEDQQSKTDITSKASATPTEDAENATEASTSPSPEEIAEEIKAAYLKGYKQARQEIKAAQQAQRIRRTAQRTRVLTQARRRPKAYKG